MLRRMLVGGVIAVAAVVGWAGTSHAQFGVDLGIHFGSPPAFEPVPQSPVQYAPSIGANLFSYGGEFFLFLGNAWYVGAGHNGPWSELPPQYVPQPVLAVPVRYYHERPREWAHWRHDAPPRWTPGWGNRWEERYAERRHVYMDEHRGGVRPTVYRDDHRYDGRRDRYAAYRDDHRDPRQSERPATYRDDRRGSPRDDHRDDHRGGYR